MPHAFIVTMHSLSRHHASRHPDFSRLVGCASRRPSQAWQPKFHWVCRASQAATLEF